VPSISDRLDDIMPLVHHFLPDRELSLSAENALKSHHWQGNVRELENTCKRVAVLKPQGVIEAVDFAFNQAVNIATPTNLGSQTNLISQTNVASQSNVASQKSTSKTANLEVSKEALESAMRDQKGVIARVARQFGLSRQALYRRLDKFGIPY